MKAVLGHREIAVKAVAHLHLAGLPVDVLRLELEKDEDVPEFVEWDFVKFRSSFGLSGQTDVDLDQLLFGEAERGAKQVVGQVFHASKVTPETVGYKQTGRRRSKHCNGETVIAFSGHSIEIAEVARFARL
jgi:hypothetical protein